MNDSNLSKLSERTTSLYSYVNNERGVLTKRLSMEREREREDIPTERLGKAQTEQRYSVVSGGIGNIVSSRV